jgi:sRNA-binding regulator protein Hfq
MEFNPLLSLQDTLKQAQAEKAKISIHLRSGEKLSGVVGGVGDHHVVLTRLTGREFFDALVRIDDISAIEAQVRTK